MHSEDIAFRLFEESRRPESIDIAQTRRFLERATKQRAWTQRELDDFFNRKKGPEYQNLKEYIFRYQNSAKQKSESYQEMEARHRREIDMEQTTAVNEYNSNIGYMTSGIGVVNPRETLDQMNERHGWERLINTNKTLKVEDVLNRYKKFIEEESNAQRKSYLVNILNYFSKNFQSIRGMTEKELLQRQQIEQQKQKTETHWIRPRTSKSANEEEQEAMERGEFDRVVLGANLRPAADLFRMPETPEEKSSRHVIEKLIRNGGIKTEPDLTQLFMAKFGAPKSREQRERQKAIFKDLKSYWQTYKFENDKEFQARLKEEQTSVGTELVLFMY